MLCNFLKNVDLLKPLGNQETTKIARALHAAIFNDGEKIITQGDEGEIFYMIYKGTVICTRTEEDGHERELIRLGPGEFFGERALQKREKRAANCIGNAGRRAVRNIQLVKRSHIAYLSSDENL